MTPTTAAPRRSCSARGGKQNWDARAQVRKQRIAEWMPTVSEDDQVALWLASKVVVRVLSQMRGAAG